MRVKTAENNAVNFAVYPYKVRQLSDFFVAEKGVFARYFVVLLVQL